MERRDVVRVVVALALGAALGLTWRSSAGFRAATETFVATWQSAGPRAPPRVTFVGPGPRSPTVRAIQDSDAREVVSRMRAAVAVGRPLDALRIGRDDASSSAIVLLERSAIEAVTEPTKVDAARVAELRDTLPVQGSLGEIITALLDARPDGLGDRGSPLRDHARSYVRLVVAWASGSFGVEPASLERALGADPNISVDVVVAWAAALDITFDDPVVARSRGGVQAGATRGLLPWKTVSAARPAADRFAMIAADAERSARERAAAAMLLAELCDLPAGLDWSLQPGVSDADVQRTADVVAEWNRVRDLAPGAALRARVQMVYERVLPPGPTGATAVWVLEHAGDSQVARDIGRVYRPAIESLRGALPERLQQSEPTLDEPERLLHALRDDSDAWLLLDQILRVLPATASIDPPVRLLHPIGSELTVRWAEVLGLTERPLTLRVAEVERRLDGVRIVRSSLRSVVPGSTVALRRDGPLEEPGPPDLRWRPPGAPRELADRGHFTEMLDVGVAWETTGPAIHPGAHRVEVRSANGGGSSSNSGGQSKHNSSLLAVSQYVSDHDPEIARSVWILMLHEDLVSSDEWTLDDWRAATASHIDAIEPIHARMSVRYMARAKLWDLGVLVGLLKVESPAYARLTDAESLGPKSLWALYRTGERVPFDSTFPGLAAREVAELLLAPEPFTRDSAASWLSRSELVPPSLAREILDLGDTHPEALTTQLRFRCEEVLALNAHEPGALQTAVVVGAAWLLMLLAAAFAARGLRGAGRGLVASARLIVIALALGPLGVEAWGVELTPGWAVWPLAALGCHVLGRTTQRMTGRVAALSFAAAALFSLSYSSYETRLLMQAEAASVLLGALLLAPLAVDLVRGVRPARASDAPPRAPGRRAPVRLVIVAAILAVISVAMGALALRRPGPATTSFLVGYGFVAWALAAALRWRFGLASLGESGFAGVRGLPLPVAAGLGVVGAAWIVGAGQAAPSVLAHAVLAMISAQLYVAVRLVDAARVQAHVLRGNQAAGAS